MSEQDLPVTPAVVSEELPPSVLPPNQTDTVEAAPALDPMTAVTPVEPPIAAPPVAPAESVGPWKRVGMEIVSGVQTLVSAAVYATLIVTFVVQVARVDGLSMAPTLEDHDRLIV